MRNHFCVAVINVEMDVQRGAVGFIEGKQQRDSVFVVIAFIARHQHGRFAVIFRRDQPFVTGCIQLGCGFRQWSEINKRIGITAQLIDAAHHHHQRHAIFANQIGVRR
ncbi:hypothetical protein D3C80_1514850 [compost metagenome]